MTGQTLRAGVVDAIGVTGLVLTATGVYELWGRGWALFAAGVILLGLYAAVELAIPTYLGRRRTAKRAEG